LRTLPGKLDAKWAKKREDIAVYPGRPGLTGYPGRFYNVVGSSGR